MIPTAVITQDSTIPSVQPRENTRSASSSRPLPTLRAHMVWQLVISTPLMTAAML